MPASPRLLIVVNDAAFFLSHRLSLALGARAAGFDVHVATPRDEASPRIEAAGLPFHAIPLSRRGTSPAAELRTIAALVALYRDLRPDIVHHVTAKPILYGGLAARIARVPAVVHAVSGLGYVFISDKAKARVIREGIRATYRVVTSHPNCAVIFQNEDDRHVFGSAIRTKRVVMIRGSGVDLTQFRATPLPDGVPLVVLPSRMLWDKGVGEFVAAARLLKKKGVVARFALVGGVDPGNPAGVPRERIDQWVHEGDVEWWGIRSDMPSVLAESTIVCLPSYREGMPKSLLEACAAGRPIVTTDVPGCRDVLAGGGCGVLVPPRDDKALSDALGNLLAIAAASTLLRRAQEQLGRDSPSSASSSRRSRSIAPCPFERVIRRRNSMSGGISKRLPAIDALRGVAVLTVLVSHLPFSMSTKPAEVGAAAPPMPIPEWLAAVMEHGRYGVHLFLIISGFCIHMAWARRADDSARVGFGAFWRRRLHRLYPPYLAALMLSVAGLFVLHGVLGGARSSITASLGYVSTVQLIIDVALLLILAQNLNGASHRIGNGPFWTLALEEQLYALYFPLLFLRRRYGWKRALIVVAAVTMTWRTVAVVATSGQVQGILMIVGPARWFEWTLGALAVEAHLGRVTLPTWCRSGLVGVTLLGLAVGILNLPRSGVVSPTVVAPFVDVVFGIALFTLLNHACATGWAGSNAGSAARFFGWVGTFSYSLYLTHQLAIVAAKNIALRLGVGPAGIFVCRGVAALAAAWVFYHVVERRFIHGSRRAAVNHLPPRKWDRCRPW